MKKFVIVITLMISVLISLAQDYTTLHNKYWYYRTRLRNDFMMVGTGAGCSIPMEQRGVYYKPLVGNYNWPNVWDGERANWGDALGETGYYIGVLATEYELLNRNGQETDSVLWELYCCLF